MNITLLTLIPKVDQALHEKDFKIIACCTMLYKIIAKALTNRLGEVIHEVVSPSQVSSQKDSLEITLFLQLN